MAPRFHARHDAVSRAYFYQISTRKAALSKRFVWWIKEPLDIASDAGRGGPAAGPPRLSPFRAQDPSKPDESTIVVVESAEVAIDEHLVVFRIEASHYLWRMVRRVTGVLVKVGKGEVSVKEFGALLEGKPNPKFDIAAWTAPAAGLFLEGIRYGVKVISARSWLPRPTCEACRADGRVRCQPLRAIAPKLLWPRRAARVS